MNKSPIAFFITFVITLFVVAVVSVSPHTTQSATTVPIVDTALYNRLRGRIILTVESKGAAYYIHPKKKELYSLGSPSLAFTVMGSQGTGISNADIVKIRVALNFLTGPDADSDGLPDYPEDGLGTDRNKADTDGDTLNDKDELAKNFDPLKPNAKLPISSSFSTQVSGMILLQVQKKGEAWYVDPVTRTRHFLGRPSDALFIMRQVGLGISNRDFDTLIGKQTGTPPPPSAGTRDPALWPFTATSPWNHPIGTNAQYADIVSSPVYYETTGETKPPFRTSGSGLANLNCQQYSKPVYLAQPSDPVQGFYFPSEESWKPASPTQYNWTPAPTPTYTARVPLNAKRDPGTDGNLIVIDENKQFFIETWKAQRQPNGDIVAGNIIRNSLTGTGIAPGTFTKLAGIRAAGVSSLGGLVRKGELVNGIPHALASTVLAIAYNKNGPNGKPYVWPAGGADGHWATSYVNTGNMSMGTLLAIPQSVDLTKVGIQTSGPMYEIAKAMQKYGVYLVDSGGGNANLGLFIEPTACNELEGGGVGDMDKIISLLKVVTNNSPTSIGGGGTPIAPMAPSFDPKYTGGN